MSDSVEFPKLMWLADGREVTVVDQEEKDRLTAKGASLFAPGTPAADVPVVALEAEPDDVEAAANEADEEAETETPKKRSRK